jgi:hypothetical protein
VHSTVIGENAESVSIAASSSGGAEIVRAVNIGGGTVTLGNENAVISLSADNPASAADAIQISGAKAELNITAKELNVSASANKKAVGIRISDNAKLTVDAVTNVSVVSGTDTDVTAEGIRVYNANGTKTILPATQDAVFKKAVTVNVSGTEDQSARGVSVLSSAATEVSENDPDNGAKLTLEDTLTVNVSSNKNASGVEVDNNFLDGSRAGTTVIGTAGNSAELEIGKLYTADVSAAEQAVGARVMKGGTLTAKGGMAATVSGNKAYGIFVTDKSTANIAGPVSLTVSGQTAGYGIYMSNSTAAIGTKDTDVCQSIFPNSG